MAIEELQNGRYQHVRLLGSGGMGEVYLMQDARVSRQVAIKVIRSEGALYPDSESAREAARLFQREARAIAALEHPNILPLYDFGEEVRDGTILTYMVMPFCTEGSLAGWLMQRGPMLTLQDVSHLVDQAAEGLQHAHDQHVIHLDVKPSNFLLRGNKKTPNRPTLLLADFGIARNFTTVASSSRTIRGTPTSMAPEQWSSEPVPATDQYALAVMVYEVLAGRPPFVGSMEQLMFQHFSTPPPAPGSFNQRLPAALDTVILRALAKKPEDRFPSISAFASAFEQAANALPAEPVHDSGKPDDVGLYATLAISPSEAEAGSSRSITLPGGQQVHVPIPPGTRDGQVIRLQDLVGPSTPVGELVLTIAIKQPDKAAPSSEPVSVEHAMRISDPGIGQTVYPVSDHDLPTLASSKPAISLPEKQQRPPVSKKSPARRVGIIGSFSVVLVALLLFGTIYFISNRSQSGSHASNRAQTATTVPTRTLTATPQPGLYIADTYNGSLYDQTKGETTVISVLIVQSRGDAVLSGSVTFKSPTQGVYPLSGTVDLQGNFSFSVQQPAGQIPLVFYGTMQNLSQGMFLKGNFCSSNTNHCSTNTGYFTVGPGYSNS